VLAISRIAEIHKGHPTTHLVMHGSTRFPNGMAGPYQAFGGAIPETYCCAVGGKSRNGNPHRCAQDHMTPDTAWPSPPARRECCRHRIGNFDPRHFQQAGPAYMKKVCLDRTSSFSVRRLKQPDQAAETSTTTAELYAIGRL